MAIQAQRTSSRLSDRRESWETDDHEPAAIPPSGKRMLTAADLLGTDGLRQSERNDIRWLDLAPATASSLALPDSA